MWFLTLALVRIARANRKLKDLNQDSVEAWLLRIMELSMPEAILEEREQK
jgi:hypothetical protein